MGASAHDKAKQGGTSEAMIEQFNPRIIILLVGPDGVFPRLAPKTYQSN